MDQLDNPPDAQGKPPIAQKEKKQQNQQKQKQAKSDGAGKGATDVSPKERQERNPVGKASGDSTGGGTTRPTSARQSKGASRLAVFDHLPRKKPLDMETIESDRQLHPAIVRLGVLYSSGAIYDDDDRVCALYSAFYDVVEDYKTPPNKNLSWDLDKHIRLQVWCRCLSQRKIFYSFCVCRCSTSSTADSSQ